MRVAHILAGSPSPDVANGVRKYAYFIARAQAALGLEPAVFWLTEESVTAIPDVLTRGFPCSLVPFRVPGALLDQLAVPTDARRFAHLAARLPPGRALPAPHGIFPRFVEAEAAGG